MNSNSILFFLIVGLSCGCLAMEKDVGDDGDDAGGSSFLEGRLAPGTDESASDSSFSESYTSDTSDSEEDDFDPVTSKSDECIAICESHQIKSSVVVHWLDVKLGSQKLLQINLTGDKSAKTFLRSGIRFHAAMKKIPERVFVSSTEKPLRLIFVDFDGVAARRVLSRMSDNREFVHVLDTTNCLLLPDLLQAIKKLRTDSDYDRQLSEMIEKITPSGRKKPEGKVEQAALVQRVVDIFREKMISAGGSVEGYSTKYHIVNQKLVKFLREQMDQGAELFILSGRKYESDKGEFLAADYGDIFAASDLKSDFAKKNLVAGGTIEQSCSYIYSERKNEILINTLLLDSDRKFEIMFIDDNVSCVAAYRNRVSYYLEGCFPNAANYLFIPYPMLAKSFDDRRYLEEVYNLIMGFDDEPLKKIQAKLFDD